MAFPRARSPSPSLIRPHSSLLIRSSASPIPLKPATVTRETEATDFEPSEDEGTVSGKMQELGGRDRNCSPGKTFRPLSPFIRGSALGRSSIPGSQSSEKDRSRALQDMAQSLYASFSGSQSILKPKPRTETRARVTTTPTPTPPTPPTSIPFSIAPECKLTSSPTFKGEFQSSKEVQTDNLACKPPQEKEKLIESLKGEIGRKEAELASARTEIEVLKRESEAWKSRETALRERVTALESRFSPQRRSPKPPNDAIQRELEGLREKLTFEKAERRRDADCMDNYVRELQGIVALLQRKASKSPSKHPPTRKDTAKTLEKKGERGGLGEGGEETMEREREKVGIRQLITQLACIPENSRSLANKRRRLAVELELSAIEANLMAWKETHFRINP